MRLHRLEITAFGPFAHTATVDFDALATDGLFLLFGDTGAGKTTVLDAIAFALYGTVPGQRRECKRLHSDHAPADVPPRVVLEATLGGRRLRLTRSPEHERPKRRGTGVRTEPAKATLSWLDGRGQNLSRITEVGDEIIRLLGMSADQFFQVVLLPQGDFARFLCAANEDREALLEKLFDTQRFGTAEQWLAAQRRESGSALERYRHAIERLGAQICTAAGIDDPGEYPMSWAEAVLDAARAARSKAAADLVATNERAVESARALEGGRRTADLQRRLTVARRSLADLAAAEEYRASLVRELADARRAVLVAAAHGDATRARRSADRAYATMCDLRRRLSGQDEAADLATLAWPGGPADVERIDATVRRWAEELGRLSDVATDVATAATLDANLQALQAEAEALRGRRAVLAEELANVPGRRQELADALRIAERDAATVDSLTAIRDAAVDAVAAAREFRIASKSADEARREAARWRDEYADARETVLDLREARLAGMAAELAGALRDGEPCMVCGSVEHPVPAAPEAKPVTQADESAAEAAERHAGAKRDTAQERVAVVDRTLDALVRRGGDRDPAVLLAEAERAHAELGRAQASAKQVGVLTRSIAAQGERATELETAAAQLAHTLSAATEHVASVATRREGLRERIDAVIGDESVETRISRLEALSQLALALRDARATAGATAAEAGAAADRAESLAAEAGFTSAAEAVSAARPARRVEAIEGELAVAADQRARAAAVLADPDVVAVADAEPVDVTALETRHGEVARRQAETIAANAMATDRAEALEDLVAALWAAIDRLEPAEADHAELDRIADIVAGRGENTRRMSLRSYVLAARLEEVAIAASRHLRRMSGGRFEFVHSDASGPRGRRGGLGLEVRDEYTGSVRPAKTLSGGETFTASLALALGLADVVAAEAGGVALDTMFIDEGFGSLDDETLDSVMGVLDELRAGGRVVGIVSHVDEIRQRIPNRLHVIRGRSGSRLEALLAV